MLPHCRQRPFSPQDAGEWILQEGTSCYERIMHSNHLTTPADNISREPSSCRLVLMGIADTLKPGRRNSGEERNMIGRQLRVKTVSSSCSVATRTFFLDQLVYARHNELLGLFVEVYGTYTTLVGGGCSSLLPSVNNRVISQLVITRCFSHSSCSPIQVLTSSIRQR